VPERSTFPTASSKRTRARAMRDESSLYICAFRPAWVRAFASLATTWLTQRHQEEAGQRAQEVARRERLFVEFIDLSSKAFVDALPRTTIDPLEIIPLYATCRREAPCPCGQGSATQEPPPPVHPARCHTGSCAEVDSVSIALGGRLIYLNIIPNRECT
jgi:hypothetical protein